MTRIPEMSVEKIFIVSPAPLKINTVRENLLRASGRCCYLSKGVCYRARGACADPAVGSVSRVWKLNLAIFQFPNIFTKKVAFSPFLVHFPPFFTNFASIIHSQRIFL